MKHFLFLFVFVFTLVATKTNVNAQIFFRADSSYLEEFRGIDFNKIVASVWVKTCRLNEFLDSNLVPLGSKIKLPLGYTYTALDGDHQWKASKFFVNKVIIPYLQKNVRPNEREVNPPYYWGREKTYYCDTNFFFFAFSVTEILLIIAFIGMLGLVAGAGINITKKN